MDYTSVPLMRSRGHGQAPPSQIRRVVKALRTQEMKIASAEKKLKALPPSSSYQDAAKVKVKEAVEARDYTRLRLDAMLNYAQEHTFDNPSSLAQASLPFLKHIIKNKEDILLTAEAAAGHSGSNDAFEKLVAKCHWLIGRFTSPLNTPLEEGDALSGALRGIWDAVLRYDPLRESTTFGEIRYVAFATVAYNWVFRNTRPRKKSDLRDTRIASLEQIEELDEQQGCKEDESEGFPHQYKLRRMTTLRATPYMALARQDLVRVDSKITDEVVTSDLCKEGYALYKKAISE